MMRVACVLALCLIGAPAEASRPALEARIVKVDVERPGTLLEITAGRDLGIDTHWHARIIDDRGHPVLGGELVLIAVRKRSSVARCKLDVDQVHRFGRVRLEPP